MSKGIGRLLQFGVAKETVRGTAESGATFWVPFSEASLDEKQNKITNEQAYGVIEDSFAQDIGKQWAEGTIKAPIGDKHFGLILLNVLGTVNTADNADSDPSVKDHTFTVGQSAQHQALTVFLDDPLGGQDYKHALGMINSLEIVYERGQYVEYSANVRAKKGATATLSPSTTSENRFTNKHLTFKLASNLAGLGAASATVIKSLKLSIEQNLEDDDVLGSLDPADFLNKQFTITGTVEAIWQNESDFKTAFLANTAKAMRIDLVNSDVTIGSAANPQLRIDLAKVYFEELTRPIQVNDVIMQTLGFKAVYSSSDSKAITILLTNTQASY
jgi:hypothetical protein